MRCYGVSMIFIVRSDTDYLLLLFVFSIDSLDFLSYELSVILELLYLAVHLVDEAVTLLATCIEETEVVLVGLYFLL